MSWASDLIVGTGMSPEIQNVSRNPVSWALDIIKVLRFCLEAGGSVGWVDEEVE